MKRDPQLHDLSRDHHHALVLARRAERTASDGSDDDVGAMWQVVNGAFETDLNPHFAVEEEFLLPPLAAAGETSLAARTRAEHERLRRLLGSAEDARDRLRSFGELLRLHVRFEESQLFPAAEKALGADDLAAIAKASAATENAVRRAAVREAKEG